MTLKDIELMKTCNVTLLDQEDIWTLILGEVVNLNNSYRNPTRTDNSPGCRFVVKDGVLFLKDFSTGEALNCVKAYSKIYGIAKYIDAYKELYVRKLKCKSVVRPKIDLSQNSTPVGTSSIQILIEERPFNKFDEMYWAKAGLSLSDLKSERFRVVRVDSYTFVFENNSVNKSKTIYLSDSENSIDTCYAYLYETGRAKLYFPFRSKGSSRFKSNLNENMVYEEIRNPKEWIITKSHKDFLLIRKMVLELKLDVSVTHVQNEGSFPKRKEWLDCDFLVLFDNDEAGIKASQSFQSYYKKSAIEFIPNEKAKDLSELVANTSYEEAKAFLESIYQKFKFDLLFN